MNLSLDSLASIARKPIGRGSLTRAVSGLPRYPVAGSGS
jgi:hypothetical protein